MKEIKNSSVYNDYFSDTAMTVGTNLNGEEFVTFVFMSNTPNVITDDNGQLQLESLEKTKQASVTMTESQARRFYSSLEDFFKVRG